MRWTSEAIQTLREGYASGTPARQIAKILGTTKGSVVGKADRLDLRHPDAPRTRAISKTAFKRAVLQFNAGTARTCQFPHGDPRKPDFRFCGSTDLKPGSSYCEEHHKVCYRKHVKSDEKPTYRNPLVRQFG